MPRNFHSRVEVMAPIDDPVLRLRLLQLVEAGLDDTAKGSVLRPDGRYERRRPEAGAPALRSQDALERAARGDASSAPELRRRRALNLLGAVPPRLPRCDALGYKCASTFGVIDHKPLLHISSSPA